MPYSFEELKNNEYWQKMNEADEIEYQEKLNLLRKDSAVSGSDRVTLRDDSGIFQSFEDINNPGTGIDAPHQYVYVSRLSPKLKTSIAIDNVLDREIKELI